MGTNNLDTNLDQSPYFADFNANDQYYQVLVKPSAPIQARELNNIQLALQNQIGSFGNNIFTQGTIISGCNINLDPNLKYVKLLDTYANGSAVSLSNFTGLQAVSNTSGLVASIFSTAQGFISQAPNLNTLFIKYLNTGYVANSSNLSQNVAISTFQPNEIINIVNPANVVVGTIQVANDAISGNSGTVGNSYSVSVDAGQIFQKGYALVVNNQSLVVSSYDNQPNNISVGFVSQETIVTAFQDPTLLDNAQGSPNFKGPGADRLKIIPTLEAVSTGIANNDFFAIVDFIGGNAAIINQDTSFNVIGDKIAQISSDTNGNFVISPFNLSSQLALLANGSIDANNFRLNISSGLGYIQGERVNILSQIFTTIRKGTDVNFSNAQVLTAQMGSFINVKEVYGTIDVTDLPTVGLLAANSYGISNNAAKGVSVNSMVPSANIGTATMIGFVLTSGNQGLPSSSAFVYLTNIQMAAGHAFNNVASIYANNGTRQFFADVQTYQGQFGLNQPQFAPLVYDLGQQAVQSIKTSSNTIDTQFQFEKSSGVSFSSPGIATVTIPSFTGGINELPFGVGVVSPTLTATDFIITAEGNQSSANLAGSFTAAAAATALVGTTTTWDTKLYPGAIITLSNTTATEIKMVNSVVNSTSVTLVSPVVANWSTGGNVRVTFQTGQNIPLSVIPTANINVLNSTAFTVYLGTAMAGSLSANVAYPILRANSAPATKSLLNTVWVTINCASHAANSVGPWCLGIPDGYAINNVYVGTTLANTNPDLKNQFNLVTNQQDTYYGLSYLQTNGAALSSTSRIMVSLSAFSPSWSSSEGFFSVDSYPIDDTGVTANTIRTQDIPYYYSIASQSNFNLRNSLDFRFYASNTIPYLTSGATAAACTSILNPSSTLTFNQTSITPVVPSSLIETSYSYYQGRYDQVGLSANGRILLNEGTPSASPVPGGQIINGMNIGTVFIPPYPSLTQDVVDFHVPFSYPRISFVYTTNKRYTMQDIGAIDQRLNIVEYYSALSLLEQSVTNLLTQNQNGLTVFQNGMFADPLQNFSLANCADPAFNIAIDSAQEVARPVFSQYPITLKYVSGGNTGFSSANGRLIFINASSNTLLINQPFASQVRNCAQDVTYTFSGTVYLNPDGDYQPDVTVNPAVVANINDYQNFAAIAAAWGTQWGTWNEVSTTSTSVKGYLNPLNGITDVIATSSNTTTSTRTGQQLVATPQYNEYQLGTAITSISIQPFARAALIRWTAIGLKPLTQHWVFVNDVAMANFCFSTNSSFAIPSNLVGSFAQPMVSDAQGNLFGFCYLPGNTFKSGTLNFQVLNISNNVTQLNVISSQASTTYYATNLAYTENNLELQTVTGQLALSTVTQSTTSTAKSSALIFDPVGQSFSVLPSFVPDGSDCVYLKSINLYFQSKDPSLGVTIQVRPLTSSGLPDQFCLPYGSVHLTPSQVTTSQNASIPTVVIFDNALLLETGSNYCFIVIPDGANPNYNIWTAVLGATNVTGGKIYQLSSTGVMLMSSQGVTWTPYQTESLKFGLNVINWPLNAVGTASFTNDDSEFFNTSNVFGAFHLGDSLIIANMSNNIIATGNATINATSNTIVTGNTTGLASNTQFIVTSTNNQSGFRGSVVSVTNSTAFIANLKPTFSDTLSSVYITNGNPTGVVSDLTSNLSFLRVGNSTANSSNYLTNAYSYAILDLNSNAFLTATGLHDKKYNTLMGKFAPTIPAHSNISITVKGVSNSALGYVVDGSYANLTIGVSSDFLDVERAVMARSNELQFLSGSKSLTINANMTTNSIFQSPTLDAIKLGAHVVHNLVIGEDSNNDILTSEINNSGNGVNRYISTTVNLAAGMDAENLTVYLGAHWPQGSQVYVYAKLLNQFDPGTWQSKAWSPLTTLNTYRASPINLTDFIDYQFNFSNTVTTNGTAYLDPANNNLITYQSGGVNYATFVAFAIKIVLLSNNSPTVPMVTDLRAVCTTA